MNYKTSLFPHALVAVFCFVVLSACSCSVIGMKRIKPSKATSEMTTEFKTLHSVVSGLPFGMVLTQHLDEVPSITMTGANNYIEAVKVDYSEGSLRLTVPSRTYYTQPSKLRIKINVHDLRKMGLSGTGDAVLDGAFKVKESRISSSGTGDFVAAASFDYTSMHISSSGTGDVTLKNHNGREVKVRDSGTGEVYLTGECQSVNVSTSGTGDVYLSGTSHEVSMGTSGTGDISAKRLTVQDAKLRTSGTGDISCVVVNTLDASTSGTGDITVYGQPRVIKKRESGTGDIDFRSLDKLKK